MEKVIFLYNRCDAKVIERFTYLGNEPSLSWRINYVIRYTRQIGEPNRQWRCMVLKGNTVEKDVRAVGYVYGDVMKV